MEPLVCSIEEAAQVLGVSKSTVNRLLGAGELLRVKIGRRTVVSLYDLEEYTVRRIEAADNARAVRRTYS